MDFMPILNCDIYYFKTLFTFQSSLILRHLTSNFQRSKLLFVIVSIKKNNIFISIVKHWNNDSKLNWVKLTHWKGFQYEFEKFEFQLSLVKQITCYMLFFQYKLNWSYDFIWDCHVFCNVHINSNIFFQWKCKFKTNAIPFCYKK